ncbi:NepR family anti-sigma factor [Mycoplana dimorpha]|uniref:NepR family anti-sigma factor n=1 Tax=Mycoplana dimorpha TaxID=28320 RepID=UPI000D38B723|nr:NepR family anti-sigma factor [Mycoplana dimorpha]
MEQQNRPELPAVPAAADAQIAHRLRSFYLSVQEEPIPQRFLELLERLDVAEQRSEAHLGGGHR